MTNGGETTYLSFSWACIPLHADTTHENWCRPYGTSLRIIRVTSCLVIQAELRALEEGDVSACGSSPRSDFSQSEETQKAKPVVSKWKVFVPVASPTSSRSSSKTGRETPETGECIGSSSCSSDAAGSGRSFWVLILPEMGAEAAECPVPVKEPEPESESVKMKLPPKPPLEEADDDVKVMSVQYVLTPSWRGGFYLRHVSLLLLRLPRAIAFIILPSSLPYEGCSLWDQLYFSVEPLTVLYNVLGNQ